MVFRMVAPVRGLVCRSVEATVLPFIRRAALAGCTGLDDDTRRRCIHRVASCEQLDVTTSRAAPIGGVSLRPRWGDMGATTTLPRMRAANLR